MSHKQASSSNAVLFEGVSIGRHAKMRRAIIDEGVSIPAEVEIGCNSAADRGRGLVVTDYGVTARLAFEPTC